MAPGRSLYAKLMVPYFGLYAVTMMYNPTKFWGPKGLGMIPYFTQDLGDSTTLAGFFARMVGLGFLMIALAPKLGANESSFVKQTMVFHVGALPWFYKLSTYVAVGKKAVQLWTPWAWQLQCVVNVLFAVWGYLTLSAGKKKKN